MTLLRRIILLLAITLAPMQLAWAGQMSLEPAYPMTVLMPDAQIMDLADCCEDGSHQTPTCQIVSALPVGRIGFGPAPHPIRGTPPGPCAYHAHGRVEAPDLRPPIPA